MAETANQWGVAPAFIGVEGIIGAGKSELATRLSQELNFELIEELDDKTNPYLQAFYEEVLEGDTILEAGKALAQKVLSLNEKQELSVPALQRIFRDIYMDMAHKEIAIKMQWFLLNYRYRQHLRANIALLIGRGSVIDRTVYGDTVFVRMLVQAGKISAFDAELTYFEACKTMLWNLKPISLIIFLDVKPEKALERCLKLRGREVESKITFDYLRALQQEYEKLIQEMSPFTRIIRLDWNSDRDVPAGDIEDVIAEIKAVLLQEKGT